MDAASVVVHAAPRRLGGAHRARPHFRRGPAQPHHGPQGAGAVVAPAGRAAQPLVGVVLDPHGPAPVSDPESCPCPRSRQQLRQRQEVSNGRVRIRWQYQCLDCGRGHGYYSRQPASRTLAGWDHSLPLAHQTELEAPGEREWWRLYAEYLRSDEWRQKRERCLAREAHLQRRTPPLCQACWRRDATTAHHATYRRLRREPLFDLLAVCGLCHDHLHDSMSATD